MFFLREIFRSIRYTATGFVFSIITSIFGLVLLFFTLVGMQLPTILSQKLTESFKVTVFIKDGIDSQRAEIITSELKSNNLISRVDFISEDQAANIFMKKTGEDFRGLLESNPLPASFRVTLATGVNPEKIQTLRSDILKINGVEEVAFEGELFVFLQKHIIRLNKILPIVTFFILLGAFYLNFSTTSLSLEKRKAENEIMLLVGSKLSKIRLPVVFYGVLIGIISTLLSIALIALLLNQFVNYFGRGIGKILSLSEILLYWGAAGIGIGLVSGLFCARKIKLR